jgi:hypothetical protein
VTRSGVEHAALARRLLAHQVAASSRDGRAAAIHVLDALFAQLAPLIGATGVLALFARSVVLAKAQCPGLKDLVITIDSLAAASAHVDRHFGAIADEDIDECATVLCATFLALVSRFVGDHLTVQLVMRAWPDVDVVKEPK